MMHSLSASCQPTEEQTSLADGAPRPLSPRRRRRGATAMEYLVAASFILVVLILAVQHLGEVTRSLFDKSANATNPNQPAPK